MQLKVRSRLLTPAVIAIIAKKLDGSDSITTQSVPNEMVRDAHSRAGAISIAKINAWNEQVREAICVIWLPPSQI